MSKIGRGNLLEEDGWGEKDVKNVRSKTEGRWRCCLSQPSFYT
jgi:hypothetical protein